MKAKVKPKIITRLQAKALEFIKKYPTTFLFTIYEYLFPEDKRLDKWPWFQTGSYMAQLEKKNLITKHNDQYFLTAKGEIELKKAILKYSE